MLGIAITDSLKAERVAENATKNLIGVKHYQ